jgi:hypothetical protein
VDLRAWNERIPGPPGWSLVEPGTRYGIDVRWYTGHLATKITTCDGYADDLSTLCCIVTAAGTQRQNLAAGRTAAFEQALGLAPAAVLPKIGGVYRWGELPDGTLAEYVGHHLHLPGTVCLLATIRPPSSGPTAPVRYIRHWSGGWPLQGHETGMCRVLALGLANETVLPMQPTVEKTLEALGLPLPPA